MTFVVAAVVIVAVFFVILPEVIDYEVVWETFKALDYVDFSILLLASLLYFVPEGWLYALVVPGMSLWRGIKAWIASTGVGSTVPALDLVTRFGMYSSWGFSADASMRGILLSGAFDWVVKFSLPVLAVITLFAFGVEDLGFVAVIAGIAGVILAGVLVVLIGAVRSEKFTSTIARRLESIVNWVLPKVRRDPIVGLADKALKFRDDAVDVAAGNGILAFIASALGKLMQYIMLLISLRAVGIPSDVLGDAEVFIVWAIVMLITMIPITPGGIGIAELFYVYFFTMIAGDQWSSIAAAGVMLYRVFQWALPIPLGWWITMRWRRKVSRGILPDSFANASRFPQTPPS